MNARCHLGRPSLFVMAQPDFWVLLGVYVCLFESIIPRDFIDFSINILSLVKS